MNRREITLALLAAADGQAYTPVQIQKALFLLSREASGLFSTRSTFHFDPYDYGPFDKDVYAEVEQLAGQGLSEVLGSGRGYRVYAATSDGVKKGREILANMGATEREYVTQVSNYVRRLSFQDLVSAIYKKYPEMRKNSVFVGS